MFRAGAIHRLILGAAGLVAAGLFACAMARGSDYIGANGSDWSVPTNWSAGIPSGSAASANISLAPLTPFNIFMNFNYSAGTALGSVNINSSTAQMLTVTQRSTANLFSGDEFIGNTGKATFEQSRATNSVSGGLLIGYNAGSTGIYNLSGSGNVY